MVDHIDDYLAQTASKRIYLYTIFISPSLPLSFLVTYHCDPLAKNLALLMAVRSFIIGGNEGLFAEREIRKKLMKEWEDMRVLVVVVVVVVLEVAAVLVVVVVVKGVL